MNFSCEVSSGLIHLIVTLGFLLVLTVGFLAKATVFIGLTFA